MEKTRTSPLASLFPWLAPLVISFALVENGIEIQLSRNNRLLNGWFPKKLRHVLPAPLLQWIEDNHMHIDPQPYPLVRQLWQELLPLTSKKFLIDAAVLAGLEEISQPRDFALAWSIQHATACVAGQYQGAERYLGMGWFQRGPGIWKLKGEISPALDAQLKKLNMPVDQADSLLNSVIPGLSHYLPTYADFQLIRNFTVCVTAPDIQSEKLTLAMECSEPQLLPVLQIPQQCTDILLAKYAIIHFPHQALTPALRQLLQESPSITMRGAAIPQFISEQLPVMLRAGQMSESIAAQITQVHPIVPVSTLKPIITILHQYKNGLGQYSMSMSYPYQQHILNMEDLLAENQRNRRFARQHGVWFEWPANSQALANTIRQSRMAQMLRPEEVMGFDLHRIVLAHNRPATDAIWPEGKTPAARARSLFSQLRQHGVPGGIIGEPTGLASLFIEACREMISENWSARVLWLTPSNKKGPVTRALHKSMVGSHVTVASLVTLRDEPGLFSSAWTLVIFQELDRLLDGSLQASMLSQLRWQWALTSITSYQAARSSIMSVLHLSERYHGQFCKHFLFDIEKSYQHPPVSKATPAQRIERPVQPAAQISISPVPVNPRPGTVAQPVRLPHIHLNQQKIARLQQESAQLQERLGFGAEEEELPQPFVNIPPEPVPVTPGPDGLAETPPEVDEDWQLILQQWRPEHWEILLCLYQEQVGRLAEIGRKAHRPVSQLIDEINVPVDEQLGDLLIDAETQTIFSHWHATAEKLARWYFSSRGKEFFS